MGGGNDPWGSAVFRRGAGLPSRVVLSRFRISRKMSCISSSEAVVLLLFIGLFPFVCFVRLLVVDLVG